MKFVYTLPLLALLTGCVVCNPPPSGDGYCNDGCGKKHRKVYRCLFTSGYSMVNNTGSVLDVFQDGVLIHRGVQTGQVVAVRPAFLVNTTITVVGRTETGEYVGTDSWIYGNAPEVWTITRLYKPQPPH